MKPENQARRQIKSLFHDHNNNDHYWIAFTNLKTLPLEAQRINAITLSEALMAISETLVYWMESFQIKIKKYGYLLLNPILNERFVPLTFYWTINEIIDSLKFIFGIIHQFGNS